PYGAIVAAYTTVVAYGILTVTSLYISQRVYAIPYNYSQAALLIGLMIALAEIGALIPSESSLVTFGMRVAVLTIFAGVIVIAGVIPRAQLSSFAKALAGRRVRATEARILSNRVRD